MQYYAKVLKIVTLVKNRWNLNFWHPRVSEDLAQGFRQDP